MTGLEKLRVYCGSFWQGWVLVNRIKRTGSTASVAEFLDSLGANRRRRRGLAAKEICRLVLKAARHFRFHKAQPCLARSLAAFYYLKLYGHDPCLLMEIDFESDRDYNCHCWVCLAEDLARESGALKALRLQQHGNFIMLAKTGPGEGDGQRPLDKLLQPEVPLLLRPEDDGAPQRKHAPGEVQESGRLPDEEP